MKKFAAGEFQPKLSGEAGDHSLAAGETTLHSLRRSRRPLFRQRLTFLLVCLRRLDAIQNPVVGKTELLGYIASVRLAVRLRADYLKAALAAVNAGSVTDVLASLFEGSQIEYVIKKDENE